MKKFLQSLFTILIIVGIAGGVATFKDAMLQIKGETVDLNVSTLSDFKEDALVEGELYDLYTHLCTKEITRTSYGIETGKTETNFYVFSNYSREDYINSDDYSNMVYVVYATAKKDEIEKIDKLLADWQEYSAAFDEWYMDENSTDADMPEFPADTISFKGKICDFTDKEVEEYLNEFYTENGMTQEDISTMSAPKMILSVDTKMSMIIFFAGIALFVIGVVGHITLFVKEKKRKAEELY